ncbi:MAG: PfkB family carbohydrate kinase [Melioribacteraceae bacterium]|nr:PfkB family carbohydrate kinase [Melioribacteraceae bacterium]
MVLTVTLNPLLEKKLYFENTNSNKSRAYKEEYLAGGKGINISRQLNLLGIQNHALIFLGGNNGKKLRSILESENISFSVTSTKNETREACLIFDDKEKTLKTYFGVNSTVTDSEIEQFLSKLEKAIMNSSIVVFSGSLPNADASIIIEKGIELCNKHDKISILDTYGEQLQKYLSLGPTIIHNNIDEIRSSLRLSLDSEIEISQVLKEFYDQGLNLAFITNGNIDIFASKADFHYKVSVPKIIEKDPTGSGDAFVAGIIYGLEKSLIFNDFVKLAAALGAQNASSWEVCKVDLSAAKKLEDDVSIAEIGKKIKLIDDSPTI